MSGEFVTFVRDVKMSNRLQVWGDLFVNGTSNIPEVNQLQTDLNTHTTDTSNPHNVTINNVKPTSNKGELIVDNGTNAVSLSPGIDGLILVTDATSNEGIKWDNIVPSLESGNLKLEGNVISSTNTNGNITLSPNGNGEIVLSKDPISVSGVATKGYVDSVAGGLEFKESVRVKTVNTLPNYIQAGAGVGASLTGSNIGALNIDGVTLSLGDRVLVTTEGVRNGIYTLTQLGDISTAWILTRAVDADEDNEVKTGMYVYVEEGDTCGGASFVLDTVGNIVVDTTPIQFAQFAGAANISGTNVGTVGVGLFKQKNGNTMEFKKINAGSGAIVVNDDVVNDKIDIDIGSSVVTLTNTQTLTNKSMVGPTNNIEASALLTSTGAVAVNAATAPINGQVLTATTGTTAIWKTPDVVQYFYAYDIGGNTIINSSWTDLPWDTNPKSDAVYSLSGTEITFSAAGNYIIDCNINTKATASSSRSGVEIRIVVDTGSGTYTEIPGTRSISYIRMNKYGTCMSISAFHTFGIGDKIKVQADRTVGSATIRTLPNGCRLNIRSV